MSLPVKSIKKINSLKETLMRQAEWKFAEARGKQQAAEVMLQHLETDLSQSLSNFTADQCSGLSALELVTWNNWLQSKRDHISKQAVECQQLAREVSDCRDALEERHREKEMWSRLEENQVNLLLREYSKKEQEEMNEIGVRSRKNRTRSM